MIKAHIKKRPNEAWLGGLTAGLGLWIMLPGGSMLSTGYTALLGMQTELVWGCLFFLTGLAHLLSVIVNGMRWWTPISRAGMSLIMCVLYISWAWGFWLISPSSTGVFIYLSLSGCAGWCFQAALYDTAVKIGAARNGIYS